MKTVKKALPWIIYLSGCLVAYPLQKTVIKRDLGQWTVRQRGTVLVLSIGSWATALVAGFTYYFGFPSTVDKPANW